MAAATDPSSAALSPRFRRSGRNLPSPWSHVVRGEPDPASPSSPASPAPTPTTASIAPLETTDRSPPPPAAAAGAGASEGPEQRPPDGGDQGSAAAAWEKKSAWSRLSNGTAEAEPVMGAVSWPALSEATKASPKSSSSETLKVLSDGSVFAPPAPVVSSPPPKQTANISNSNSSTNYASPARQKSGKRGGGTGSGGPIAGKAGAALPNGRPVPALTLPTSAETSQSSPGKVVNLEQPIRDLNNRAGSNWDHGPRGAGFPSQLQGGNEHQRSYGGNRRGNNGGGGSHHNPGNRRDQERGGGGGGGGGYDWNHRSFGGGRDVQMQQRPQHQPRPMARPFVRPPPFVSAPFITTPPPRVSPFGGPLGYHDIPSPLFYLPPPPPPESLGGLPFVAPPAMFFAAPDPQLQSVLAKQIEYYFSPENLCKDIYLRQNMDGEGWVPISLIAGFNRVRNLTNNVQFILDTVKVSTVVEVQGDRIRRRNDWMNWPPLATTRNPPHSSATSNYDSLAARMRNVGLEEHNSQTSTGNTVHTEAIHGSTSGESNRQSSMVTTSNGDGSGQTTVQTGSDRSCLQEA